MKKERRVRIWNKYDKHCAYCGKSIEYKDMQVDHFIPKCRAHIGKHYHDLPDINAETNLMPSCRRCNHYKRSYMPEGFRKLMMGLHGRVQEHYINKVAIDFGIMTVNVWNGKFFYEEFKKENTIV